jgi:hypothetical protein
MRDLFETPELIPQDVQTILETFNEDADPYHELDRLTNELEAIGYTFDYYLATGPYGLRPVGVKLQELEGWEHV